WAGSTLCGIGGLATVTGAGLAWSQRTSGPGGISFWGNFTETVHQAESAGAGFPNRSDCIGSGENERYLAKKGHAFNRAGGVVPALRRAHTFCLGFLPGHGSLATKLLTARTSSDGSTGLVICIW